MTYNTSKIITNIGYILLVEWMIWNKIPSAQFDIISVVSIKIMTSNSVFECGQVSASLIELVSVIQNLKIKSTLVTLLLIIWIRLGGTSWSTITQLNCYFGTVHSLYGFLTESVYLYWGTPLLCLDGTSRFWFLW